MSEAIALGTSHDGLGPAERLHPLYLLTGLGRSLRGAWGMLALGALFASQGRWWALIMMTVLFGAFSIGALYLRWLKLEYRVGDHEIRIDSGFLNRTSRAIPFDRITDVDLEQDPVQRLFGLARVKLETGASAGSKEEEGVLHTIALERAEALREHIRARRGFAGPHAATRPATEPRAIYAMNSRRILIAGLFNFSLAVIAGLFGLTQTMGDALGFDPFEPRFWTDLLARSSPLQNLVMAHQMIAVIGGSLLLILLGVGTGLVRTTLREHGFRLDRTETGFRRRRGLLTLTDVSIPAKRAQAAILANGPVRQHFGWWVLKLQSLAQDGGRGDHVVAPLADDGEAASILDSLGWPIVPTTGTWRTVSKAYVNSHLIALVPVAIATVATLIALGPIGLLGIAVGAAMIAMRWLAWRRTRYALDHGSLFVETGWWRHRRNIVPTRKIQSVDLTESWWSRLFGICTLRLGVAGGSGFADHHVPALARPAAEALRAELLA
ncbi:PH domain-containing protein [Sphingomonas sp. RB56-2]|uniref:PH domain-containing protein n=1 Tax=Sphingomonas brevis TaxID=2908206 RepID=A0ABT0S9U6_9SPHN|nr:PH domain-containing protein [Sphingomonas brevis]MCL6741152.1 PH domain-containing protein [Sphingomonas brevis]